LDILRAYENSLQRDGHVRDDAQLALVTELAALQKRLHKACRPRRGLKALLGLGRDRQVEPVQGAYIWGGVGRGKTFIMDLFFDTLAVERKRRIHFHRMMHDVHARLKRLEGVEDPLDTIAADIARDTRVLCFDEFFVSDIGDAMILGRLLDGLFRRGVTLVTTSNSPPDELYRDGLQRSRFLPAIELIKAHAQVINMDGGTDYRLRLLQRAGTYLHPDDAAARSKLQHFFDDSASSHVSVDAQLEVNGRSIRARQSAKGIVWFDFEDICDGPRSHSDYIEIARWYPTVLISGLPVFDADSENQARRFIALVDEFYDRNVKLILSAASGIDGLYRGSKLRFEFDRTSSRLIEMQSTDYLALPHLA
jgi:cell division protein ZapE